MERRHGQQAADTARSILDWFQPRVSTIWWGEGRETGSFVPTLEHGGVKHQVFAVYTSGVVELYFQWYQRKQPFDNRAKLLELLERINQIPGVNLGEETLVRRPTVPLLVLAEQAALEKFFAAYAWYLEQVQGV